MNVEREHDLFAMYTTNSHRPHQFRPHHWHLLELYFLVLLAVAVGLASWHRNPFKRGRYDRETTPETTPPKKKPHSPTGYTGKMKGTLPC